MITMYYDKDADLAVLNNKKIAVLGYGSQGHAHALNLHDSGMNVTIGLRADSKSRASAQAAGLTVKTIAEASDWADVVMVLLPDQHQKSVYETDIGPYLKAGDTLAFAHGFNIHYNEIKPAAEISVIMIAPKSPGHLVRRTFEDGKGVPCLVAVHQDPGGDGLAMALAWAKGIGGTRAGVIETNFKDETETDLFGEQAVLCGGSEELVRAGFETLVGAGYPAELAYFECLHELKLIVDLYYEGGLAMMNHSVSDTAEYGGMTRGSRIITDQTRQTMKDILAEIQDGRFAREWIAENDAGQPVLNRLRKDYAESQIEKVGAGLRKMMSWIAKDGSEKSA